MREFRLPNAERREAMSIAELEKTLDLYTNWYFREEEGMTSGQADRYWAKRTRLEKYIEKRKAE